MAGTHGISEDESLLEPRTLEAFIPEARSRLEGEGLEWEKKGHYPS